MSTSYTSRLTALKMSCFRRKEARTKTTESTKPKPSKPFPIRQIFILALCRSCEPIAFMSIFPYIYFMIESFHITSDDRTIALYAGLVTSAFAFAEFMGGTFWGRLSDRYGRKPILLCGMAGTGISMMAFGFATNLPLALIARALGGLLNGNIGVLQTTVAEIVTEDAHRAIGFSVMPSVWCIGTIIGSILGGALADPVANYGWSSDSVYGRYPFLLPNLVSAAIVVLCMLIGVFFMEESHEERKHRKDFGIEAGRWFVGLFRGQKTYALVPQAALSPKVHYTEQTLALLQEGGHREDDDDALPGYRSTESSPQLSPVLTPHGQPPPAYQSVEGTPRSSLGGVSIPPLGKSVLSSPEDCEIAQSKPELGFFEVFTKPIMLLIAGYGLLAYHTISAEQLIPVFLSLPPAKEPPRLPFFFDGGFGLPTKTIGGMLSFQGLVQVTMSILIYPYLCNRLGGLRLLRITASIYPLLYLLVPYITLLPAPLRMVGMYMALIWKVTLQACALPCTLYVLTKLSPSNKVLGTLNGAAASAASLSRAFGPTISGLLQTAGLAHGMVGLPWWINSIIAIVGAVMSLFLMHGFDDAGQSVANGSQDAVSESARQVLLHDEHNLPDQPLVTTQEVNATESTSRTTLISSKAHDRT